MQIGGCRQKLNDAVNDRLDLSLTRQTTIIPFVTCLSEHLLGAGISGACTRVAAQRFGDYTVMWSPGWQLHDIDDGEDLSDFDE
jgi:hypothetical protein